MEIWIQFLMEVIYLGWKLAVIMSWVIREFKADLMATCILNYIQTWVKAADGRVPVELISILNLMKFWVNKRIWWLLCETWNNERATMARRQRWVLFAEYALLIQNWDQGKNRTRVALWRMLQLRFSSRIDYEMIALSDCCEKEERGHRHLESTPSAQSIQDMG